MDAVEMLKERRRLTNRCAIKCEECRLSTQNNTMKISCSDLEHDYPDIYISIIEDWSKDCPKQTYLSKLLEVFPDTELRKNGTPAHICPSDLGLKDIAECTLSKCIKCWDQTI